MVKLSVPVSRAWHQLRILFMLLGPLIKTLSALRSWCTGKVLTMRTMAYRSWRCHHHGFLVLWKIIVAIVLDGLTNHRNTQNTSHPRITFLINVYALRRSLSDWWLPCRCWKEAIARSGCLALAKQERVSWHPTHVAVFSSRVLGTKEISIFVE